MSDDEVKPKVVNLFGREEFKPERQERTERAAEPDLATIKSLEALLEAAKAGEVTGLVALSWGIREQGFWRRATIPIIPGLADRNAAALALGALHMLADDLADIAFWTDGYEPLVLDESVVTDEELRSDADQDPEEPLS